MVVAYALGGGLGHLTRATAAIRQHHLTTDPDLSDLTLVTSSPFATDRRVVADATVVRVPASMRSASRELCALVVETIDHVQPSMFVVDAFPAGILGELHGAPLAHALRDTRVIHLARALRWDQYARRLPTSNHHLLTFDRCVVVEPLPDEQLGYLQDRCEAIEQSAVVDPPASPRDHQGRVIDEARLRGAVPDRPLWLVVHAGPPHEVDELVAYAAEHAAIERVPPHLVLITPSSPSARSPAPQQPRAVTVLDVYPAWPLFRFAERVYSGGGSNVARQMARTDTRHVAHVVLPFHRTLDDQYRRAHATRGAESTLDP